ncbi:MAG: DUF3073 domain-containing protein [Actinomycetaceae bacterium]|nr:DUF3073 domain-containing protein [Actinomycetaceae bacterium]MDY5854673.1 DUF3073 domain-containing protein [Arcanobacterium sp.]
MGRGRQRAKQRKVARDLKYFSPQTDYEALERELSSHSGDAKGYGGDSGSFDEVQEDDEYAAYAELAAKYAIPDDLDDDPEADDGSWAAPKDSQR